MATNRYVPVKLPLYVGKGEESDPQGRRSTSAFESKGVRYFDKDTISAHRELSQRADITSGEVVVASEDEVFFKDSTGVNKWDSTEGVTGPLSLVDGHRIKERRGYFTGSDVLFTNVLSVGDQLVTITLSGGNTAESDNSITLQVIDPDSSVPSQEITVVSAGYNTCMRVAESNGTIVVMTAYNDQISSIYNVKFNSFIVSSGVWTYQNTVTHTATDTVTSFDITGASATQFLGAICSGDTTTEVTELFDVDPDAGTISSVAAPAGAGYIGTDSIATYWDGSNVLVASSGHDNDCHFWSFTSALSASAATALTGDFYGQGDVATGTQGVTDITITPNGSFHFVCISGLRSVDGVNPDDGWGGYHSALGTTLFTIDAAWTTATARKHIGSAILAGDPWVNASGRLEVPMVLDSGYPQAAGIDRGPWVWLAGVLHSPVHTDRTPPSYGAGLVVETGTSGDNKVVGTWGVDEAFIKWWEFTPGLALDYYPRAFRAGGSVEHSGTRYIVYPAKKTAVYSASQLYSVESPLAQAVSTPGGVATSVGGVLATIDGADVEQLPILSPPVVAVYPHSTLPAAVDPPPTNYAFVRFTWAWVSSQGVVYRSPPSERSVWPELSGSDLRILPTPPPPISPFIRGKLFLEAWSDTSIDSKTTQTGIYRFIAKVPITSEEPDAISLGPAFYNTIDGASRLLYTTGGVLPYEAPSSGDGLALAGNRMWYIRGNRAFFSFELDSLSPIGFNSNFYVSAPDGNDVVAISEIDEQAVLLTSENVFIIRGRGPSRTGQGGSFSIQKLPSPTGCLSETSVVAAEQGVFFLGHRGIHLVQRNMSVVFVGRPVTDSLNTGINFSVYDRTNKEVQWFLGSGGHVSFHTESGLWSENTGTVFISGVHSVTEGRVAVTSSGLFAETGEDEAPVSGDTWAVGDNHPFIFSTPWIDGGNVPSGFIKVRSVFLQGRAEVAPRIVPEVLDSQGGQISPEEFDAKDPRATLAVKVYKDLEDTPVQEEYYDLDSLDSVDPLRLRCDLNFRKCTNFRVQVEIPAFSGKFLLSGITADVLAKDQPDKQLPTEKSI